MYIFYSMFGFQRTGDGLWAAGDQMGRGFVLGATAGRTTLTGEGLQHADGHSHLLAATMPHVVAYDPAYGYEIGHIVKDGLRRMYGGGGDNPRPDRSAARTSSTTSPCTTSRTSSRPSRRTSTSRACSRACTCWRRPLRPRAEPGRSFSPPASACGGPWRPSRLLADDWSVAADVWSVTSWTELARDGERLERARLLDPSLTDEPYVTRILADDRGPVLATSDYQRAVQNLIAPWVPGDYLALGADGFGFSDTRAAARRHFLIDGPSLVVATLSALERRGEYRVRGGRGGGGEVPAGRRQGGHLGVDRRGVLNADLPGAPQRRHIGRMPR